MDNNYDVKVQFKPKVMQEIRFPNSMAENLKITHVFLSECPAFAQLPA